MADLRRCYTGKIRWAIVHEGQVLARGRDLEAMQDLLRALDRGEIVAL